MEVPKNILEKFAKYTPEVEKEIKELLSSQDNLLIYDMMSYFFGFKRQDLTDLTEGYGGKRFRPGLCLLLADFYQSKEQALEVATGIEVFHNFSLIHDDIEDNDPLRRGRPTVWKIWGERHAINAGDSQLMLSIEEILKGIKRHNLDLEVLEFLNNVFVKIAEGQFMDFYLSDLPIEHPEVTEEKYLEMISRKTAYLVGASAKVAGMIAKKDEKELQNLWDFGFNLGVAYQLNDDLSSIWGKSTETGKVEANDLEERKKTLPLIYLFSKLDNKDKIRFSEIYNQKRSLTHQEISEIKLCLDEHDAHRYTWDRIKEYLIKSEKAILGLNLKKEQKEVLLGAIKALIPELAMWDA